MKITIISPTYNEKINIQKLIPVLEEEVLPKVKNHDISILIVDDNSPDGTAEEVKTFMKKWKNIHLISGEKQGLGAAYVRGMHYAMDKMQAEAIIEFDADFQHDPQDIPRLIVAMDKGADYVIGSRYIPGGQVPKEWGLHRKIISKFGGLFAQLILWNWNIHDMTGGYKLTKTSFLKHVDIDNLYSQYYAYKLHILHDIVRQGAKVVEVPIVFYERKEGSSKITQKDLLDSFLVVIRLRLRDSARVLKFLFVGGTGFIIQLLAQEISIQSGLMLLLAVGLISTFGVHQRKEILADALGAGVGAEAAILSNFFLNNFWTFKDTKHVKGQLPFFIRLVSFNLASIASVIIQFTAIAIAEIALGQSIHIWHFAIKTRIIVLFPTIILLVIPLNYIIYNKFIWKTQNLKKIKS